MQITIRLANKNDVDAIRFLYRDTIIAVNSKDYSEAQIKIWSGTFVNVDSLLKKISDQYFLVAEANGQIIGFSSLQHDGLLYFMYVHKDFQGIGVAGKLLEGIIEKAKKIKLKEIVSHVSITAKPFFEKKGFEKDGEIINKIHEVEFVNSIMIKKF